MPRGDHLRKVTSDQIVEAFEYDDFGRELLAPDEVAKILNRHILEDEEISAEAVRQRMHKIPELEKRKLGGGVLWKKQGAKVFASHTPVSAAFHGAEKSVERIFTAEFWWNSFQLLSVNIVLIGCFIFGGLWILTGSSRPLIGAVIGSGLLLLAVAGATLEWLMLTSKDNSISQSLIALGSAGQKCVYKIGRRLILRS